MCECVGCIVSGCSGVEKKEMGGAVVIPPVQQLSVPFIGRTGLRFTTSHFVVTET